MRNLAGYYITAAIIYAIAGMALGIWSGLHEDFSLSPVHGHLNLVGWVSFAVYGLTFRAWPEITNSPVARFQFWTANAGALIFIVGLYMRTTGGSAALVSLGSLIVLAGMILFLLLVLLQMDHS
ncbi:MAG: hypothetical protein RIE31_09285 [Alphaproteobacteria bacterium]